jgi:hypothetical protein
MEKTIKRTLVLALSAGWLLTGQTTINGGRQISGPWDASGALSTKPARSGTTLPSTCAVGEQFFKTDATAGQNLHFCTAVNVWTQMSGGTGGGDTASNVGPSGVGVFEAKVGSDLQFRKLNPLSDRISIALDGVNKKIDLDVTPGNIQHQNLGGAGVTTHAEIDSHVASTNNPHGVTAAQAGAVPESAAFGAQWVLLNPYQSKANWYKGQLHAHCLTGAEGCVPGDDGDRGATTLANDYKAAGASFLAITSHSNAGSYPVTCPDNFLCISRAAEVGCSAPPGGAWGHMTEWGVTTAYAGALQTCINNTYTAGGLASMAHPDYGPNPWSNEAFESTTFVEFAEVWNAVTSQESDTKIDTFLAKGRRLWMAGVDDHHSGALMNGYVVVNADSLTWSDIKAQLRAGNFYALKCTSGTCPTLTAISVTGATISVTASTSGTFTWIGRKGASTPLKQESGVSTSSYTVTGDPWAGDDLYVRLRFSDTSSRVIWTQPFWVTRVQPSGQSTMAQKVKVAKAGAVIGTRSTVNLIEGSNVSLTVADSTDDDRVNVTVTATGAGTGTVTHTTGALTADQPMFGNAADDAKVGTKSGNTNKVVTMGAGTPAENDCAKWDANGNLVGHGSACGTGGGAIAEQIGLTLDGNGTVITTGQKGYTQLSYACTINSWTLLADQAGSIVVDIWKNSYANYPPTDADSITGSAPPTLSSANKATSSTLTGWTTAIDAGDILGFNVDSATAVTRVRLIVKCTR